MSCLLSALDTRRASTETMEYFESYFSAQAAKLNYASTTTTLSETSAAFMLLFSSAADDSQPVFVMAAASPFYKTLNSHCYNDEFVETYVCQKVA